MLSYPFRFVLSFIVVLSSHPVMSQSEYEWTREELLGHINPASNADFVVVSSNYTRKTDIYLREETYQAFEAMWKAAKDDGIRLEIISATRTWGAQKGIWNRKWDSPRFMGFEALERAREILKYSSMPGTSRHHWGTDIDLNSLENEWFESGEGLQIFQWLIRFAPEYGFHQVYTEKSQGRTGYEEERWHWSYIPLSSSFLNQYVELICDDEFDGFKGSEYADSLKIIQSYVQGVQEPH